MNTTSNDIDISVKKFLKQGLHYKVADFLYTKLIGPVVAWLEKLSARSTAKWCEERIPARERSN